MERQSRRFSWNARQSAKCSTRRHIDRVAPLAALRLQNAAARDACTRGMGAFSELSPEEECPSLFVYRWRTGSKVRDAAPAFGHFHPDALKWHDLSPTCERRVEAPTARLSTRSRPLVLCAPANTAIGSRRPAARRVRHSARAAATTRRGCRRLDRAVREHEDPIGHADAGKAVRDQDRRLAPLSSLNRLNTSNSDRASSAAVGSSRMSSCASRM